MKTILVTGLDGSGKSTFFSRISAANNKNVELIFVPHINMSVIAEGTALHAAARMVNELSAEADRRKEPRLKALSIFASMLLFQELIKNVVKNETAFLFYERHPLIDSGIYAQFYAGKMNPTEIPISLQKDIDDKYESELKYLLQLLPSGIVLHERTMTGKLAEIIYTWFHVNKKTSIKELEHLFTVRLPDEIYFLKASAEVLYERIRYRDRHEPHESIEVLRQLSNAYEQLLRKIGSEGSCKATYINAENISELDRFSDNMLQKSKSVNIENYPIVPGRGLVTAVATKMRTDYLESLQYCVNKISDTTLPLSTVQHNIESFIGTIEIPVGLVGPLLWKNHGREEMVYCAAGTLEGALVASMNRGAKAISMSGGFEAEFIHQKMSRAPMFRFANISEAVTFSEWLQEHFAQIKRETKKHSNHATLTEIATVINGRNVHAKFIYNTADASGQNMTTTCTWYAMLWIVEEFQKETGIKILSHVIEGNGASDKKVSAYSVIAGRGVHVVAECFLQESVINKILRTTSDRIVECYNPSVAVTRMDGMMGYNINVANAIAAIFVATGQDLASIHESSTAILSVEKTPEGLYLSLNIPSLVIGTVGGGTHLPKQNEALKLMGCAGTGKIERFARLIAGFALSLEISTYAAIVSGEFAKAHEKLGRNKPVKWLLRSEITPELVKEVMKQQHPGLKVLGVKIDDENNTENGIITNLAGRASKKLIGFVPLSVSVPGANDHDQQEKKILVKSKALDAEVIRGFHLMAASIDPELSDLIYEHRDNLEYHDCHNKEIKVYDFISRSGVDSIPVYYGSYANKNKEAYLIFQEFLKAEELRLFNSENSPALWDDETICKTISAITDLHKQFSGSGSFEGEFKTFSTSDSRRLYEKLAEINSKEEENPLLQNTSARMRDYINDLEQPVHDLDLPLTLVHNDFNPRNIAVRNNGKICIYDWELVVRNVPHRDIVELLSFVLSDNFSKTELDKFLEYHYSIAGEGIDRGKWNSGYRYALKEFLVTRVSFYKAAGIVMKLKFSDRIMVNAFRMLDLIEE